MEAQVDEEGEPLADAWTDDADRRWFPVLATDDPFGKGLIPAARYENLPSCLDGFGRSEVTLEVFDPEFGTRGNGFPESGYYDMDAVTFEVFFEREAENHPGDVQDCPEESLPAGFPECPSVRLQNSVHYYSQQKAAISNWAWYGGGDGGGTWHEWFEDGEDIRTLIQLHSGIDDEHLHNFATVVAHENHHDWYYKDSMWLGGPYVIMQSCSDLSDWDREDQIAYAETLAWADCMDDVSVTQAPEPWLILREDCPNFPAVDAMVCWRWFYLEPEANQYHTVYCDCEQEKYIRRDYAKPGPNWRDSFPGDCWPYSWPEPPPSDSEVVHDCPPAPPL